MEAEAMAYKRNIEGYDYATEKQFEFLNNLATNENAATGISSDMLQMGAGLGMLGAVGGMMQNITSPFVNAIGNVTNPQSSSAPAVQTTNVNVPIEQERSVLKQNEKANENSDTTNVNSSDGNKRFAEDPIEVLKKLKVMLDAGLIEQVEYDAKKKEILSRM